MEGWYSDIDLKNPWDFETDTVQGSMTLYVKWAEGDPVGTANILWWIIGLILPALLLLLLFLLLNKKTVSFDTGCHVKIKKQKVRKGHCAVRPENPVRLGRTFAGWYQDEAKLIPWDFEQDTVEKNTTLYAKWM